MEVLTAAQMRQADAYTIAHEPITSIDLMERAARACYDWISERSAPGAAFYIFCGPGNNGGDGLALARMLYDGGYAVRVFVIGDGIPSPDHLANLERLQALLPESPERILTKGDLPGNLVQGTIIDALFGTGLSRPPADVFRDAIVHINLSGLPVISIDMPSGLLCDFTSVGTGEEAVVRAHQTLTFQFLRKALLVGENQAFYGKIKVMDIGLHEQAILTMDIRMHCTDQESSSALYRRRPEFSHKGTFGHALLFSGGKGKTGAAILAAGGCLRSGAGLVTLLVPAESVPIVQSAVPESMAEAYGAVTGPGFWEKYSTFGAGPGIGTGPESASMLKRMLHHAKVPLVLDADALNLLAADQQFLELVPADSILTPHPGEFRRLAGSWSNDFEKLELQLAFADKHKVFLLLKGKNTTVATPDGHLWFNTTGNSGMAKGGSGDVLTGLLTGLLASGYPPRDACLLGVWLHGKAGDLMVEKYTPEAMKAGDLINMLGAAWKCVTGTGK